MLLRGTCLCTIALACFVFFLVTKFHCVWFVLYHSVRYIGKQTPLSLKLKKEKQKTAAHLYEKPWVVGFRIRWDSHLSSSRIPVYALNATAVTTKTWLSDNYDDDFNVNDATTLTRPCPRHSLDSDFHHFFFFFFFCKTCQLER